MSDLQVKVWHERREGEEKPVMHILVESEGETAEHVQDAIDYVNSLREQPFPEDDNDE